jgi:hypothetical protein
MENINVGLLRNSRWSLQKITNPYFLIYRPQIEDLFLLKDPLYYYRVVPRFGFSTNTTSNMNASAKVTHKAIATLTDVIIIKANGI